MVHRNQGHFVFEGLVWKLGLNGLFLDLSVGSVF